MNRTRGRAASRVLATVALALGLAAPGCTFLAYRCLDLEQSFHYGVGASVMPGVMAHVHVPLLGATAGLLTESTYVGSDYGYTQRWKLEAGGVGIFGSLSRELDRGQSTMGTSAGEYTYVSSVDFLLWDVRERDRRLGSTMSSVGQIEVNAHALFVGVSLGLDFVQFLDFLTGWFGFDLLEDDGVDYGLAVCEDELALPAMVLDGGSAP